MLPRNHPDRIQITFDDHRLVANAGLLLPATLAQHLGLPELVQQCLDLGRAPGRANAGDKMLTLVASALAGGDCIDDADALRTGGTAWHPGLHGQGAVHPGHLPAQLPVGPCPPAGPGEPGAAGAGLGRRGRTRRHGPLTIDLDSTICETSPLTNVVTRQLARQGVRRSCVPEHRAWAPKDSPVAPPDALPRATPAADIGVRSIRPRRPRTLDRSAAWNR